MIRTLGVRNAGPFEDVTLEFGPRLNLFVGGNGSGKSFALNLIWFALTLTWPQRVNPALVSGAMVRPGDVRGRAVIRAEFDGVAEGFAEATEFCRDRYAWIGDGRHASPGIVLYAMEDGAFAVWDPMRNRVCGSKENADLEPAFVFQPREVLHGLREKGGDGWSCEGLLRDWVFWEQSFPTHEDFQMFKRVLLTLSTEDAPLIPGDARQISPSDVRPIPTVRFGSGEPAPILHASSGVRRIAALAYLLFWTWREHKHAAEVRGTDPELRFTLLLDDVGDNLHPGWRRTIVSSLLRIPEILAENPDERPRLRFFVATREPTAFESLGKVFEPQRDRYFNLGAGMEGQCLRLGGLARPGSRGRFASSPNV